jgi:hypothetical protein
MSNNAAYCKRYRVKRRYLEENGGVLVSLRKDEASALVDLMETTGLDDVSCIREAVVMLRDLLSKKPCDFSRLQNLSESVDYLNYKY